MSACFFIVIMLVTLVCVVLWDAKVKLSERHRTKAKNVIIFLMVAIGVMALLRTDELLVCHAEFPEIYQPYIMNYYPIALWALVCGMMYGVYQKMFS